MKRIKAAGFFLIYYFVLLILIFSASDTESASIGDWRKENGQRIDGAVSTCTIFYNGTYYMYYTGGGVAGIGLAASSDGLNFDDQGIAIANGTGDDVDLGAHDPTVLELTDGSLRMFYSGERQDYQGYSRYIVICSAVSTDGVNWTKQGQVLAPDATDSGQMSVPEAIEFPNGEVWVYYTYDFYGDNGIRAAVYSGATLEQSDIYNLDNWRRQDLTGLGNQSMDPDLVLVSSSPLFLQLFFASSAKSESEEPVPDIYSAVSGDGVNWTEEEGPRVTDTKTEEGVGVGDPDVIQIANGTYRMYYYGMPDGEPQDIFSAIGTIGGTTGVVVERAMYWNSGAFTWVDGHCSIGANAPGTTWYLAEGCTNGFDTWILVQNPNSSSAEITLTFMDQDQNTVQVTDTVPAASRSSYHVNSYIPDKDVSTKVESLNGAGVIAERAMYWNVGEVNWAGGHAAIGAADPGAIWYLAEGCTNGFDTWILVQNPNSSSAEITLTFMDQDQNTVQVTDTVPATSRRSYKVNSYLPDKDVSTQVESTNEIEIIVERSMYWDVNGQSWAGGHCSRGVISPHISWYLAEGCTSGFSTWILVQNPGSSSADIQLTFMDQDQNTVQVTDTIPAISRRSYNINSYIADKNISTKVESTNGIGIIAERAMYWDVDGQSWAGGHCSRGANNTALNWYLAEGCTNNFAEYLLIQNPGSNSVTCQLTFMDQDQNTAQVTDTIPGTSRRSYNVNTYMADKDVSTQVECVY